MHSLFLHTASGDLQTGKAVYVERWGRAGTQTGGQRLTLSVAKLTTAVFVFQNVFILLSSTLSSLTFSPLNSRNLCYMYRGRNLVGSVNEYHTARMEFGRVRFSKELLYSPN